MESAVCPFCGHKSIEYTHSFNKGLAAFLYKLRKHNRPCKTDDLDLTYSQRTNSQKLRYWGLAIPYINDQEAKKKRGVWQITQKGIDFVEGRISIQRQAIVRENKVVRFKGKHIYFCDVYEGYQYRSDFQKQAREQINLGL